jgi:hypothetical protein
MRILLPAGQPGKIMLGTNFGLVVTSDGGARWTLVCEEAIASGGENVNQYLLVPPPASTLYAVAVNQVAVSGDSGCTWAPAGGVWTDPFITDAFPDPTDPARVFALALVRTGQGWSASSLFRSLDGGRSFGAALFQAGQGLLLTGVESAASAPQTIYLTEFGNPAGGVASSLERSADGGGTFHQVDLLASLGDGEPRLAAVDPGDPGVVYYRVVGATGDKLAISRDGGGTARVALTVDGPLTAFLRRGDGTLLVGSKLQGAFISHDGGQTFGPWAGAPRLRALGERDGVLYAVADNVADGFAVASSTDEGKTWTPRLRFQDLCGIADCSPALRVTCQAAWLRLVDLLGITASCAGAPPAADGAVDGPSQAPPAAPHGCACASDGRRPDAGLLLLPLALFIALKIVVFRPRARRGR